jgi:hypothetical protein
MGADLRGRQVVSERSPWSRSQSGRPLTRTLTKAPESGQFVADSGPGSHCPALLSLTPRKDPS